MIDVSNRLFKVVIVAPNESESSGLDVSPLVTSFDGGQNLLDQSGLISFTGNLVLQGYADSSINTNPRSNRTRWAKGNRVLIYLSNSAGELVKFKTLHLLKEPLPPTPRTSPILPLEVGDKIALLSFRQPAGDESGIKVGANVSRATVIDRLLAKAGAGTLLGTVPGALNYPAQKLSNESYIQQAGKIAFSGGCVLWCNRHGQVRASQISLDLSPFASLRIGGDDGDEMIYEPAEGAETPAEVVRCVGTGYKVEEASSEETRDYNEEFGPAAIVDPDYTGTAILLQEQIVDFWQRNERIVITNRKEPIGLIFPEEENSRLTLVTSSLTQQKYIYETSLEGKLLRVETYTEKPFGSAAREYVAGLSEEQQPIKFRVVDAEQNSVIYDYADEVTEQVTTVNRELCSAILPDEQWLTPFALSVSSSDRETWNETYKGEWRYKKLTYEAVGKAFPDLLALLPDDAPVEAKLGLVQTSKQTKSSNSGQTQPPAPDRRRPTHSTEEVQLEGEARFEPYAGSNYQERERTYDIPYCGSSAELGAIAQLLGRLLIGRRLGQSWQIELTDLWLTDPEPLARVDFTEPDGSKQSYIANGMAIAFNNRQRYVGATGIWVGSVKQTLLPAGAVVQPDQILIEELPDGSKQIEYVEPPYVPVIRMEGASGSSGEIKAYPYPLNLPLAVMEGASGSVGEIKVLLPTQKMEGASGSVGEFIPPIRLEGASGSVGEFTPVSSNIVNGQLTRYLMSDAGVTVDENGRVLSWSDGEPLTGVVMADEYESSYRPNYVFNAIKDQPAIRFNDEGFSTNPLYGNDLLELISISSFACFVVFQVEEFQNGIGIVGDGYYWGISLIRGTDGSFAVRGYHNTVNGQREVLAEEILINTPIVISYWKTAGDIYLQINDGAIASMPAEDIEAEGSIFQLGSFPFDSKGDIGAALLYDLSLAEASRELIRDEITDKFGIQPFPSLTSYFITTSGVEADANQFVQEWNSQAEVVRRAKSTIFGFQNPPLYVANAINNQPAIQFSPSIANYTFLINPSLSQFIQADQFCCFVVFKASSIADVDNSGYTGGNEILSTYQKWGIDLRNVYDPNTQAFLGSEVAAYHNVSSGTGFVEVSQPISTNTPTVLSFWKEGGNIYLQVNDGAIASTPADNLNDRFGQLYFGSSLFDGYLGAFVSYRTALPATEREAARDQLNSVFNCY